MKTSKKLSRSLLSGLMVLTFAFSGFAAGTPSASAGPYPGPVNLPCGYNIYWSYNGHTYLDDSYGLNEFGDMIYWLEVDQRQEPKVNYSWGFSACK